MAGSRRAISPPPCKGRIVLDPYAVLDARRGGGRRGCTYYTLGRAAGGELKGDRDAGAH